MSPAANWEQSCIYQPWLVEANGRYFNFYNAASGGIEQTGLATSHDLLSWRRYTANPIVRNTQGGYDEAFCSDPKVYRDGDHYVMFYFGVGKGGAHIMVAFSRDLYHWTKVANDQNQGIDPACSATDGGSLFQSCVVGFLTAPNYPKDAFPDGIRIHFHFDGVFNGCNSQPVSGGRHDEIIQYDLGDDLAMRDDPSKAKNEKQVVGLDCVHEMNTINHYVGMYPIATGAPVEVPMSKFIIGMFAVMLLGSMVSQKRRQMMILGAGFTAVSVWMVGDLYVMGNLASFADHYYKEASTFFNQPDILARWVANLKTATAAAVAGLIVSMLIIVLGVWKLRSFALLLALVPALLPYSRTRLCGLAVVLRP